jgi:hypothetical protein
VEAGGALLHYTMNSLNPRLLKPACCTELADSHPIPWLPAFHSPVLMIEHVSSIWMGSEADVAWTPQVGHHPVYSSGGAHGDTAELQQYIEPLLHKYNVQVGSVSRLEVWHATDMS